MSRPFGGRRRRLVWAGAAVAALVVAAAAFAVLTKRQGNVSNPNVPFDTTTQPAAPSRPAPADPFADNFRWPFYGYNAQRTRNFPLQRPLRPPFTIRWKVAGGVLIEFSPVICGRNLYLLKNNGALYSIRRRDGHVDWKMKLGTLAAASPACGDGTVYAVMLTRSNSNAGRIVALRADSGRIKWSRDLPSRAESSPLLDNGRLYFGSENGTVYALRASDGAPRWTYKAAGAVKGGLALDRGMLFFGDYSGDVTAIRRSDGSKVWSAGTSGGRFGRSGQFYATPAVAYGRVYLGNTDGFVYSFAEDNGQLAWRHGTGNYVYSSPAISDVAGGTVYSGSYDGKIYAFNARTGDVRWTHDAGGKISGSATVVGDLVFYSNLAAKTTVALGAATGRPMWSFHSGAFNPVITDGTRLYLNGYSSLYMLAEKGRGIDGQLTRKARLDLRNHLRAAAVRRHRRFLARRVAQRQREVRRILDLRRRGIKVCYRAGGRKTCALPKPPVCFKGKDGRVTCRARRRG
jgi:outer membrane protein assembly factor BamB